jgi:hypothetical protein
VISAIVEAIFDAIRLWLGFKKKDAAQETATTANAMLKDAVDRPDRQQLLDELQHGKF